MKKLCSLLLAVIIVVGFALPAFAEESKSSTNVFEGVFDTEGYPHKDCYVNDNPNFDGVEVPDDIKETIKYLVKWNIMTHLAFYVSAFIPGETYDEIMGDVLTPFKPAMKKFPDFKSMYDFLSSVYTYDVVEAFFERGLFTNKNGELIGYSNRVGGMGDYSDYSVYNVTVVKYTEDHLIFEISVPQDEEYFGKDCIRKIYHDAIKENGQWKLTDIFFATYGPDDPVFKYGETKCYLDTAEPSDYDNILYGILNSSYNDEDGYYVPVIPQFSGVEVSEYMQQRIKDLIDFNTLAVKYLFLDSPQFPETKDNTNTDADYSARIDIQAYPTYSAFKQAVSTRYTDEIVNKLFGLGLYSTDDEDVLMFYPNRGKEFKNNINYKDYKVNVVSMDSAKLVFDVTAASETDGSAQVVRYEAANKGGIWKLTNVWYQGFASESEVQSVGYFQTDNTPDTSDSSGVVFYITATIIAAVGIIFVISKKRFAYNA